MEGRAWKTWPEAIIPLASPTAAQAFSGADARYLKQMFEPTWMQQKTWNEISAATENQNKERKKMFTPLNDSNKRHFEAAGEFFTELFGVPTRVDDITILRGRDTHENVESSVTFCVTSHGRLHRFAENFRPKPTKVICNDPATVVLFSDGTKTVTKAHDGDGYSWVTGIAFCCLRKSLRNRNYDRYEKPISKLVEKVYRRNPNDMGGELRAIAHGLMLMADALEVNNEA